jgi:hypothetical protein
MFLTLANLSRSTRSLLAMASIAFVCSGNLAHGQSDPLWGSKMFELSDINFGSVAKGAETVVRIKVKNVYNEEIQVTNLTTGCGCVSWDEVSRLNQLPMSIPSGQHRFLTLRLDTIRYDGERKSKASVSLLDAVHGVSTVVDFPVIGFIRKDIVITPGAVVFGNVDLGSTPERKVELHYAGRADWKLTNVKATNPHLKVALRETARGNGLVNYELAVALKPDAPIGTVRDQVIIETDDVNNPRVAVLVEGTIEADVAITDLQFGSLAPGQSKTVPVIIRGKKPFKIDELYREKKDNSKLPDDAFKIKRDTITSTVHSLPVTFTAPDAPGAFEEEFFVKIGDRPQPIPFKARGRVLEQTGAAKN